ncbi:hypothetical protein JOM56_001568 [Amanita muscaria]
MIRLFQRLGCCIPSTDVLTIGDRPVLVSEQEGLVTLQNGSARSYEGTEHPMAEPVIQSLPSNSGPVQQGVGVTLQDVHYSSSSENTRIVPIDQHDANSRSTEHIDTEFHSDRSTTQVAMFENAHNVRIENAPITNVGHQHVNIHRHLNGHGKYGLDILEKFVSFSAVHDSSAQDPKRCCHPGTRKSVLHQICNWADNPTRPEHILWLHGPAGVGKSAIAQTISYLYGRDKIGATFFFFRSDPMRNDGNRLLPTLAWQLASSVPIARDLIAASLEEYPDLPRKTVEIQFDQLIAQPFLTISGGESTAPTPMRVIIIDGLDECADMNLQERILKIIGNAAADPRFPLRFIISSRPEADIQDFFDQFQSPTLRIDLAKVEDAFRDIKTYLISEFARIAVDQQLDPKTWPDEGIIDTLVSNSSGQFVYATTIMKCVGDKYESAVTQLNVILGLKPSTGKSPFSDLDALYTEILQRQPNQKFLKEFLPILVARSMLFDIEDRNLDDAMLLDLDEKQLHRKLRGMHSLLKFEPFIDVHHKSFLDFLDDSSRSGEYHVSKHFANRRYMQLITDELVKAASRATNQPDPHGNDHFKPRFSIVTKHFPFPIKLPLDDLEEILQPLQIIQEKLLQLPNMSVPWKPRACDECWTFYMIDDLLLHLARFRGAIQLQEPKYIGICPLTATEEKQRISQLDLDACLSLLLTNLRGAKCQLLLDVDTIGLVRALVHFDPIETAMKVRSITDAQNLIELISCLNKNQCLKSWFGAVAHNATRLVLAIYGRVPLVPRSLFLNSSDLDLVANPTYQGKAVDIWFSNGSIQEECFDAFVRGNLSHGNMRPLLGLGSFQSCMRQILPLLGNDTLRRWRQSSNPSVSQIQQIVFEVANAIQYVHSLGIVLFPHFEMYLDSDNHVAVECPNFRPSCLSDRQLEYRDDNYGADFTLEANVHSFGLLFYWVLFNYCGKSTNGIRPKEPEIPDNIWQLKVQWCCAEDPKERPTMDQVVQETESWISLGQFTLLS